MGQGAAAEPPERENDQFAIGHLAMDLNEFGDGPARQRHCCRLGDRRIIAHDVDRVAARDDRGASRKAIFADDRAHAVECLLIFVGRTGLIEPRCQFVGIEALADRGRIDHPVEQVATLAQIVRQRRGVRQDVRQQVEQPRPRFQQAEQVERTGQPCKNRVEPQQRRVGVGRLAKSIDDLGKHFLERILRCGAP